MPFHLVSSKAKRAAIAKQLEALAHELGAQCLIEPGLYEPRRELRILISFGPYRVNLCLNGKSRVNALLAHWFTNLDCDARYPASFASAICGNLNMITYAKATSCEETVEDLLASIRGGLEALKALQTEGAQQ